jgi:hypothetical protein
MGLPPLPFTALLIKNIYLREFFIHKADINEGL